MGRYLAKGLAGLSLLFLITSSHAASLNYTLYISAGNLTINGNGGAAIPAWGYSFVAGNPAFPGPQITANEGDSITVTVFNNHSINHNFVVQGLTSDATAIPPGTSRQYNFVATNAGVYLYRDTLNATINREMGLYGAVVIAPPDGSNHAWTDGPAFDFQRLWVVGEMDKPRWNDVAGSGGNVNTAVYKPNYFFINGKGGFEGMTDPGTTIHGELGEDALVRIVNGGQFAHSLHFHANHFEILSVNGIRQTSPYKLRDVINVPPQSTAQVLFHLSQPGEYPMHVHTAQMETANGVYLNGVATMIMIEE